MTLRKVAISSGDTIADVKLCPRCQDEAARFGRKLTFAEWRRAYTQYTWHNLRQTVRTFFALLNPRMHWREMWVQYRFRTKGELVRRGR